MKESQFRLMDSTSETEVRHNFKWFSSGKKKCSFATSHKWSVSGRRERFGFLVWQKSAFSFKTVNSQFATIDETTSSSGTWLKHENSYAQNVHLYLRTPIIIYFSLLVPWKWMKFEVLDIICPTKSNVHLFFTFLNFNTPILLIFRVYSVLDQWRFWVWYYVLVCLLLSISLVTELHPWFHSLSLDIELWLRTNFVHSKY